MADIRARPGPIIRNRDGEPRLNEKGEPKREKRWQVRIRRAARPPLFKTFERKIDAEAWARAQEREMDLGRTIVTSSTTLRDLMLRYAKEVSPTKDSGLEEAARLERMADNKVFRYPAHLIEAQAIASYRDQRLKDVQGSTVNRELTILSAVIRHAAREWGEPLDQNLVSNVRRPKNPLPRERLIKPAELKALLSEADNYPPQPVFKCLLVIAAETAMRRGDLAKLRWRDIHLTEKYAHVIKSKNGKPRDVPLSRRARAAFRLLQWVSQPTKPNQLVFGYSDPHSITTAFRRVRERSGIAPATFHDVRHLGITQLARLIGPLELAKAVDHKDLKRLLDYYHEPAEEIAKKLG